MESKRRSLLKAISWRVTGTIDTFLISWLITGKLSLAGGIAVSEILTKTALYYFHERAWNRAQYGKPVMDDYQI